MELSEIAPMVYEAIFNDQETLSINGKTYYIKYTPRARLRFFEIEGYTFLEQNPKKDMHLRNLSCRPKDTIIEIS